MSPSSQSPSSQSVSNQSASNQSRPSLREQNAERKRQAILDAALQLFAERGFHGVAVPEVSSLAGVGAGTIYRYFANKEDLVNEVFRYAKMQLGACLLDGFDHSAPYRQRFHQFWERLLGFAKANPVAFRFLELQDHLPYLDTESKTLELNILAPILAFCTQAKTDGVARNMPAEALMALIWGAVVGIVKAQDTGYISVTDETLALAENACWDMFCQQATQS
jgi:AcrR family transcriptional regulator